MTPGLTYFLAAVFGLLGMVLLLWRPGPKWWIGVRVPWTYADREIWNNSWIMAGCFCLALALAVWFSSLAFYVGLGLLILACLLYPAYRYRQKYGTLQFWKDIGWTDYRPVVRCEHCGHLQKLGDASRLSTAVCEACGLICRSQTKN